MFLDDSFKSLSLLYLRIRQQHIMKGILLAGGTGSRLYPITMGTSKQLLSVYDKPMIYYPFSVLLQAGIKDILIISTPETQAVFQQLFGDGTALGIQLSYAAQEKPEGIAQAFLIGKEFIGQDDVCLILGDNIFHGQGLLPLLEKAKATAEEEKKATVFGYYVQDPKRYGVVEFDAMGKAIGIEEKPQNPKSNYAVVGLYFYPNDVIQVAQNLQPSARGELEITDVNSTYLAQERLQVAQLEKGFAWLDTGTHDSLLEAANYIQTLQKRQGLKIGCIEEIAFDLGYIDAQQLKRLAAPMVQNEYGRYLLNRLKS